MSVATFHGLWLGPHDARFYPGGRTLADVAQLHAAEVIAWCEPKPGGYGPFTFGQFYLPQARIELFSATGRPAPDADIVVGTARVRDRSPAGCVRLAAPTVNSRCGCRRAAPRSPAPGNNLSPPSPVLCWLGARSLKPW